MSTVQARLPLEDRKKLRKKLPRGFRKLAVERMREKKGPDTPELVSMFFSGRYWHPVLQEVLIQLAEENSAAIRQARKRIKQARS